jgi:hypothetical protein
MKRTLFSLVVLAFSGAFAHAQQTAYEAMRTVGKLRGEPSVSKLVEVEGKHGTTQPQLWKILVADDSARGGVREFEVSGGAILSERTPVRGLGGPVSPLNLSQLNLDSDGAFKVANAEAQKLKIGFDSADYHLVSEGGGSPVWIVDLVDYAGRRVGTVEVAASNGAVRRAFSTEPQVIQRDENGEEGTGENILVRSQRTLKKAGKQVGDSTKRAAGTVQEWITGRRTIDR